MKRYEIRNFQMGQFGQRSPNIKVGDCFSNTQESPNKERSTEMAAVTSLNSSMVNTRKAKARIEGMSAEEIRINRKLLEKIGQFKKDTNQVPMMGNYMDAQARAKSNGQN